MRHANRASRTMSLNVNKPARKKKRRVSRVITIEMAYMKAINFTVAPGLYMTTVTSARMRILNRAMRYWGELKNSAHLNT
ncbi:hypothetical protein BDR04DRAFT_1108331 [Suillus decipiens]|nr:hypothetical protein BDR04DRAFT_1108331 [Suillus decipiens]